MTRVITHRPWVRGLVWTVTAFAIGYLLTPEVTAAVAATSGQSESNARRIDRAERLLHQESTELVFVYIGRSTCGWCAQDTSHALVRNAVRKLYGVLSHCTSSGGISPGYRPNRRH